MPDTPNPAVLAILAIEREALAHIDALTAAATWLVDNSTPQHAVSCAGQADDDEPCICGVSDRYAAVLAILRGEP